MAPSRTLRSKPLRHALWAHADGKCSSCGCDLSEGWHADHVVPWKITKKTNVHEMQALCPACNLKKGSSSMGLRKHQQELLEIAELAASKRKKGFRVLCHVVCGGGKSWLPYLFLSKMPTDTKLCWVVPRLALQEQAAKESEGNCGIELRDSGNEINPSRGKRGVVITHQAFSSNPDLWRDEFSRHNYILVVDEPHHAKVSSRGERNALANAIHMTEEKCVGLVYMTGTLTTGDSRMIYGVDYIDAPGKCGVVPCESGFDYFVRYTRADAREENAIVPITFLHHDGPVKWESLRLGGEVEVKLSDASREQESNAIWTALSTSLADELFDRGYAHWKRQGRSLLVLCSTQRKAKDYHARLTALGERSFLAISDNDDAASEINQFKKTPRGCLVTCAMAYEGLDHKPLSHVICLTHIRSTPWIEQALARVWRSHEGKKDCFAFVPDDPRMNRVIAEIKAEEPDVKRLDDRGGTGGEGPQDRDAIPIDSAHAITRTTSLDGSGDVVTYNEKQIEAIEQLARLGLSESSEAVQSVINALATTTDPQLVGGVTVKQRETQLRNTISDLCRQRDARLKVDFGTTQLSLFKRNGKSITEMNESQLRGVLNYVESICT